MFIRTHRSILLLAIVVAVALFFLLYRIWDIPYGLNNDAAWDGSAAIDILRGNWKDYIPYSSQGWRGEALVRITIALFTLIIGHNPIVIRMGSVLFGLGIIIPLYLLIRRLFNSTLAFLTTFSVAVAGWPVTMSKVGWQAIEVPFFSTLAFLFLEKALEKNRLLDYCISAVATAGALYTYNAGRIVPVFVCAYLLTRILLSKNIRAHGKGIAIFVLTLLCVAFPMIAYMLTHWANYWGRNTFLYIGNTSTPNNLISLFLSNTKTAALMFTHRGNGNDFFISEPLLDPPMIWLFPLGIALALFFGVWRQNKNNVFMLSWFIVSLLPGIFSLPNGNRSIGAIPSVYYFVALAVYSLAVWASGLVKRYNKIVLLTILIGYCLMASAVGYERYLGRNRRELIGFYPETRVVTDFVKSLPNTYSLYLSDNYPRELLTYYLYRGGDPFEKHYTWLEHPQDFLTIQRAPNKQLLFIMFANENNEVVAGELLSHYSSAQKTYLWYHNDKIQHKAALVILVP